ncbi:hypothetical protein ACS0TY_023319 [Phlomoides rotata]
MASKSSKSQVPEQIKGKHHIDYKALVPRIEFEPILADFQTEIPEMNQIWEWLNGAGLRPFFSERPAALLPKEVLDAYVHMNTKDGLMWTQLRLNQFTGKEGSASDARVLRDSVSRVHGLKVPIGNYYLCDNGYANSPGFLAPYMSVRYHLSEWSPQSMRPQTYQEYFNIRHTRARNVIERAFDIIKMRLGILRSALFHPIQTQIRLLMAYFLLHNYIRNEMSVDPAEALLTRPRMSQMIVLKFQIKTSGNTRRVWTTREEKVLLAALKDLVAKGQKIDNGFRTGYLNKLEDALRKAFPGCDLQATPHITSKITTWRKHYSAIVSAKLQATSVGFNTTTCQLECTDDQWDSILKKDPTLRGMKHKEWHYFVDWINIFGKDRAMGEAAREVPEAVSEMEGPNHTPNVNIPQESNDDNEFIGEGQSGVHKNTTQAQGEQEENSVSQKAKVTPRP